MRVVRAAELGGLLVPPCVRFLFCNFSGRGFEPDGGELCGRNLCSWPILTTRTKMKASHRASYQFYLGRAFFSAPHFGDL